MRRLNGPYFLALSRSPTAIPTSWPSSVNISFPNAVMNAVLAWGEDNQAEGNEMAGYFIVKHEELWSSWLPADVAAKVKAALQ